MCFEAEEILGCQQDHLLLSFIPQGHVTCSLCPRHCAWHWASVDEQKNLSPVLSRPRVGEEGRQCVVGALRELIPAAECHERRAEPEHGSQRKVPTHCALDVCASKTSTHEVPVPHRLAGEGGVLKRGDHVLKVEPF